MNWNQALFPSLKRRGGCAIKKMSRSNLSSRRRGGAKRKPDRAQPQEKIGEIFRPEEFRRTDHPVCGASEASRLFINAAATPPFQGGECVRGHLLGQQCERPDRAAGRDLAAGVSSGKCSTEAGRDSHILTTVVVYVI